MYGGILRITDSTVSDNSGEEIGGGVAAIFGSLKISNSTISATTSPVAQAPAAGVHLLRERSDARVDDRGENSASVAGGGIGGFYDPEDLQLHNTIVAGNSAPTEPDLTSEPAAAPLPVSASYSLIGSTAGATVTETVPGSNILNQASGLAVLADNGGLTQTSAITQSGPAFDNGDPGDFPATDQRGIPRPQFTAPDIGAFELQDTAPPVATAKASKKKVKTKKKKAKVNFTFSADEPGSTFQCALKGGSEKEATLAPCTSPKTYQLAGKKKKGKKYTFRVIPTDSVGNVGTEATAKTTVIKKKKKRRGRVSERTRYSQGGGETQGASRGRDRRNGGGDPGLHSGRRRGGLHGHEHE